MAPSLLLDPESPPSSHVHAVKQPFHHDGSISLKDAQASVGDDFSFSSTAMNGNGNGSVNSNNGFSSGNGFSDALQDGRDFVTAQTLRQQSESYATQTRTMGDGKRPNILYIMTQSQLSRHLILMSLPGPASTLRALIATHPCAHRLGSPCAVASCRPKLAAMITLPS